MLTGFQILQHSASSVEAVQKIQVFYTQKVEHWAASKASDMIPFISPVCPSVGRFCLRDRVTSLLWLTHLKLLITIIQLQSVIILMIIIHFIYRCILVQKISNIDTIRHGRNIKLQLVKTWTGLLPTMWRRRFHLTCDPINMPTLCRSTEDATSSIFGWRWLVLRLD